MGKTNGRSVSPQKQKRERISRRKREQRLQRKLKRKRAKEREKLMESDPLLPIMMVNCQTKKGYRDKFEALRHKPKGLYVYECSVCLGWHLTSSKRRKTG